LASKFSALRFLRGGLAVAAALAAIAGILIAAGGSVWGWIFIIVGTILFFHVLNWANAAESLSMLFRRTARLGRVDWYLRVTAPFEVRNLWNWMDEEDSTRPNLYWKQEEAFYEELARICGELPNVIETPHEDGQPVRIGSHWTSRILDAWSVECSTDRVETD
jgi:hypothetical protein